MIQQTFLYECPTDMEEAISLLAEPGICSLALAGGTDLMIDLRQGSIKVDRIVDINRIPELKMIRENEHISIGAAVTFSEIIASPVLQTKSPLLVKACREIGSKQIRNVATIGGNVAHAAICADSLPALVCLEANAVIQSAAGQICIPVAQLVSGPGQTRIPVGGLIQSFEINPLPGGYRTAYERIGRRKAMSIARLSMAAMGCLGGDGKIAAIHLVPGAAFAQFQRSTAVENRLLGETPSERLFIEAGQHMAALYEAASGKRWSAAWKTKAIAAITERVLRSIFGGQNES
ncbi:MAG TPA: FAD binding domain-containing protein [Anaerolineaceae bacterium]|nr:FAD binding domain-containing protein [Anaerolineaceae bacterium]